MRIGLRIVMAGLALFVGSAVEATRGSRPIDTQILLDQLNAARSDPQSYRNGLEQYRGWFHGDLLRYPSLNYDIQTEEGVAVVDETIAWLGRRSPLAEIEPSALLAKAAATHLADQARTGGQGHAGSDGSSPGERVRRVGGGTYVAEIISYGSVDAVDAMRQLIVDDGVADRGHREIVYSAELRFAGVACGPHPIYGSMCVIDLGVTPDGSWPAAGGGSARRVAR